MEALGLSKELVGLVSALGVLPTCIICGVVLFFVIRELKKGNSQIKDSLAAFKKQSDAQDADIHKEIENVKNDLKYLHSEMVCKEDHYRDVAGWKNSIDILNQHILKMPIEFLKIIKE